MEDIYETENGLVVVADLSVLEKENISANATEDSVDISAETKKEKEFKAPKCVRRERIYERFYRSIPLPAKVNPERGKSIYQSGVLEVRLPKVEVKRGFRIKIE